MNSIIIPFLIVAIVMLIVMEMTTFQTYGWFVSKETEDTYSNLNEDKLRLSIYDSKILLTIPYITNVPFSIFCKYHIKGLGTVPRWSKLHKRINEYFLIANKNKNKEMFN